MDEVLARLAALSPEEEDALKEAYWEALNAMHPRNRTENELEPLLDRYSTNTVDRMSVGVEAGALGSRIRDAEGYYDSVAEAVQTYHETVHALQDDAPYTAAAADILVEQVLPDFMDAVL